MDIRLENLTKIYDEKTVLSVSSLNLKKGKIYGIIGPNGAGKSTLLKIIAGLDEASYGMSLYNDQQLSEDMRKNITYMNQKPYLLRSTVYSNIAYPLRLRKYEKQVIDKNVNDIMKEFNITELSGQLATSLSGGESQKVSLARALVFKPELLLLDEPTSNIDPNFLELIEKAIINRNREKVMTTIIITHNIVQAKRLCDDIVFMKDGNIIEYGKAEQVILNPIKEETKRFLSLYTM